MTRTTGYPQSSNRASSLHLQWQPLAALRSVEVDITIPAYPLVDDLYFWALQASFSGPEGIVGAAHLGLQWHRDYPGGTAVNWGGYRSDGTILDGTDSALPSALDNPHTRSYSWHEGETYRLAIGPDQERGPGWWRGVVIETSTGKTTHIRSLHGGGEHLAAPMVWTEAFCRCDAEPAAVIWARPSGVAIGGEIFRPLSARCNYQSEENGGCSNSDSRVLPHGLCQFTGVGRTNPTGTELDWP